VRPYTAVRYASTQVSSRIASMVTRWSNGNSANTRGVLYVPGSVRANVAARHDHIGTPEHVAGVLYAQHCATQCHRLTDRTTNAFMTGNIR